MASTCPHTPNAATTGKSIPPFSMMFRTPTRGNFEGSPDASYSRQKRNQYGRKNMKKKSTKKKRDNSEFQGHFFLVGSDLPSTTLQVRSCDVEESQPEPWNIHDCPTFGRMSFPLEIGVSLLVYWLTKGKLQDQIKACGKLLSIVYINIYLYTYMYV